MAMPGLASAALPRGAGLSEVLGIGDIVRVAGGGIALSGEPDTGGAAASDRATRPWTAPAAPFRTITVKAPTDRRAMSRAREPVTCTSPRETTRRNFLPALRTINGRPQSARFTLLLANGVT